MNSPVIKTRIASGLLLEDKILPPNIFFSTNRHLNTTSEDISEVF